MLSRSFKALVVGSVVAAGVAISVDPAAAQYRRYHRGYNYGPAVGAGVALGIIGLAGAAIDHDDGTRTLAEGGTEHSAGDGICLRARREKRAA